MPVIESKIMINSETFKKKSETIKSLLMKLEL